MTHHFLANLCLVRIFIINKKVQIDVSASVIQLNTSFVQNHRELHRYIDTLIHRYIDTYIDTYIRRYIDRYIDR